MPPISATNSDKASACILIIEDSTTAARFLSNALAGENYECIVASDGIKGLRMAEERIPDLILLDVQMPGIDGFETCRALKELPDTSAIPVVFFTTLSETADKLKGFEAGAVDFLSKTAHPAEVVTRVATHLKVHRLTRKLAETVDALSASTERFEAAAKGANDGIWDWDLQNNTIYYSPRWFVMLGYPEDSAFDRPGFWLDRVHPCDRRMVDQAVNAHLSGKTRHLDVEYRIADRGNQIRWVLTRGIAIRHNGQVTRMAGSQTDITETKVIDRVTRLPNRLTFVDRLEQTPPGTDGAAIAVLVLELERHKALASTHGRDLADDIARAAAVRIDARLRRGVRSLAVGDSHLLASIGDGIFAILLTGVRSKQSVEDLAQVLINDVRAPYSVADQRIASNMFVGMTYQARPADTPEEALDEAEAALDLARSSGGDRYRLYEKTVRSQLRKRRTVENDLWRILTDRANPHIADEQFELFFQPIVKIEDGGIRGCEALIRWNHPDFGRLQPLDFIPLAEQCGAIVPLGQWVIRAACRQFIAWQSAGLTSPQIAINVSRRQLQETDFPDSVQQIFNEVGAPPDALKIEVTESLAMQDLDFTVTTLSRLRSTGIEIAMDDFGTGYSSLSYLAQLPIDTVKIDRAFIDGVTEHKSNRALVEAILGIARSLGLTVIAEGVETKLQFDYLNAAGCDEAQGFLISPPLPVKEFTELLVEGLTW